MVSSSGTRIVKGISFLIALGVLAMPADVIAFGGGSKSGGGGSGGGGNGGNSGWRRGDQVGMLRNTYYYLTNESDYSGPKNSRIKNSSGGTIAMVSANYKAATDIEGSGKLADGRVINFAGVFGGEIRYMLTQNPWGDAAYKRCPLHPFHTVAVNSSQVPLGSVIEIVETIGMVLPDGSIHNGLWRADDVGGAIGSDRVDLFIGLKKNETVLRTLTNKGITHLKALTAKFYRSAADSDCHFSPER